MYSSWVYVLGVLILVAGCDQASLASQPAVTYVPFPTYTPAPTRTPFPTMVVPTATTAPTPTLTPVPSPTPTPSPTSVPAPNVRLSTSLDTVYYDVSGETTEEIFDSMARDGPYYEAVRVGMFTAGLAEANPLFGHEVVKISDHCWLRSADIDLDIVVTLPRHTNPQALSNLQSVRWQVYVDEVAAHEQRHVDIYVDTFEALKERLETGQSEFPDCDSLVSSLELAWDRELKLNDRVQDAFHTSEEQLSQRLRAPVQMHIDHNGAELDQLQGRLEILSSLIEELEAEVTDIEASMQPYDAKITDIQARYPSLVLPRGTFVEYERLLDAWDLLNDQRNELVVRV